MRISNNRWLRAFLLTGVYLLGALGIMATGGGSGGGSGGGLRVDSVDLDQPDSPTYARDTTITGNLLLIYPELNSLGDDYSDSVKFRWRNNLTGESGSETRNFNGWCEPNLLFPIFSNEPVVCGRNGDSTLGITMALGIGTNDIEVEAEGKKASVSIDRLDDRVPPKPPTNVSVTTTLAGANVFWDALPISDSPIADSYNIYYAASPGVTKANYLSLPDGTKITGAVSPQSIAGLANGTSYYFVVTGVNAYGEGAESVEVMTTPPSAPSGVSVQTTGDGATISWDPVIGAFSYNIYYASSSGVTKSNYLSLPDGGAVIGATSPEDITGLTNGTVYYFVVTAVNSVGESNESIEVMTNKPSTPTNVSAQSINLGATISWDSQVDAASYNIYYAASSGVKKSNYATLPGGARIDGVSSPHHVTGLDKGRVYFFVVTATNWQGEGAESEESMLLIAPISVKGITAKNQATVTWNPVDFSNTYNMYLSTVSGINKTNYTSIENGSKLSGVTPPHVITGLKNEEKYHIVLTQESSPGESVESHELVLVPGESGWAWQNPIPGAGNFTDVEFIDSLNGWLVGDGGRILKTSDGGLNWTNQWNSASLVFTDISVTSASNVWIVGNNGVNPSEAGFDTSDLGHFLLNTTDGGLTWEFISVPAGIQIQDIDFVSVTTGWLVGDTGFYFTDDGGKSWKQQSTESGSYLDAIDVNNVKVVSEDGKLYSTDDGGGVWSPSGNIPSFVNGIDFSDANNGWLVTINNGIYVTLDGGSTWTNQTLSIQHRGISFSDSLHGWAVAINGAIVHTDNGGITWSTQVSGVTNQLTAVSAVGPLSAWAVGEGGVVLNTSDGGLTWSSQITDAIPSLRNLSAVDFTDAFNGWVAGGGGIAHTSDAGTTWTTQITLPNIRDIDLVNSTTGWAVGEGSQILFTSDGGINWSSQSCPTATDFNGVSIVDTLTAWVVGEFGRICHTTDGGMTWFTQNYTGSLTHLKDASFISATTGWVSGSGTILYTNDGGATWTNQYTGTLYLNSIFALDETTVWVAGGTRPPFQLITYFAKTTDGGTSWQPQNLQVTGRFQSVYFVDSQNGWVGTDKGEIFTTQDGGATWTKQSSSSNSVKDFKFINATTGWFVGGDYAPQILHTTSGGFGP